MNDQLLQQQDVSSGLQAQSFMPSQAHSVFKQLVHLHFGLLHPILYI